MTAFLFNPQNIMKVDLHLLFISEGNYKLLKRSIQ